MYDSALQVSDHNIVHIRLWTYIYLTSIARFTMRDLPQREAQDDGEIYRWELSSDVLIPELTASP